MDTSTKKPGIGGNRGRAANLGGIAQNSRVTPEFYRDSAAKRRTNRDDRPSMSARENQAARQRP